MLKSGNGVEKDLIAAKQWYEKAAKSRAKIGASTGTKVKIHDLNSNTIVEYTSLSKAAVALNTTHTTISNYVKSKKPFQDKFRITINKK